MKKVISICMLAIAFLLGGSTSVAAQNTSAPSFPGGAEGITKAIDDVLESQGLLQNYSGLEISFSSDILSDGSVGPFNTILWGGQMNLNLNPIKNAFKSLKFTPAYSNGKAVKGTYKVKIIIGSSKSK